MTRAVDSPPGFSSTTEDFNYTARITVFSLTACGIRFWTTWPSSKKKPARIGEIGKFAARFRPLRREILVARHDGFRSQLDCPTTSAERIARLSGDLLCLRRFRRLVQMFGSVVMNIPVVPYEDI